MFMWYLQVEVIIPYGGQETTSILAWNNETVSWVEIFTATDCQVSFAPSPSATLPYVALQSNPCRTIFPVDTLRLVFDTDLTQQALMVDAVKLSGTRGLPTGTVTYQERFVVYVPDPFVYGVDTFRYTVTDCAFQDERTSVPSTVSVSIAGASNPPYVANTTLAVRGA